MTERKKRNAPRGALSEYISISAVILLLCPTFLFPKEISDGVLDGIKLCVTNVIPSVFPFFIIADAISCLSGGLSESILGKIFSHVFHLPKEAVSAFLCGCICGFPVGVKMASDLYGRGILSKKESEHLIGFSNNPSVAFVTTAVGVGMLGSLKAGIIIYITVITSAAAVGIIFRQKKSDFRNVGVISKQKFDFVLSVKNAGFASVGVSSYIIFFSAASALVLKIFGAKIITVIFFLLSEVSSSCKFISHSELFDKRMMLSLICTALAFSGFSVHLQAKSLANSKLSFAKYYIMKIAQGIIAGMLAYVFSAFFPF